MTKKLCAVPRCTDSATGYSTHCDNHKKHLRRHGHPQQVAISARTLRPYLAKVAARRAKNPTSEVWPILEAQWQAITEESRIVEAEAQSGQAVMAPRLMAARHWLKLGDHVSARQVVDTALAMFLLREDEPRRFQTDRAFLFQLVRRVRHLAPVNRDSYWDPLRQRTRKVYQDIPPREVEALANVIVTALGGAGLMLAAKERQEALTARQSAERLTEALRTLA